MVGVDSSIDDPPLPEPEFINHVAQQSNFNVIILWRFVLLERIVGPLDDIIHHSARSHLDIILIPVVDDCLLECCGIGSSFTELFDWFEGVYLELDLLRSCVLIVVFCYDLFGFLELVELEFLFLILGLIFGNLGEELTCLFNVHGEQGLV